MSDGADDPSRAVEPRRWRQHGYSRMQTEVQCNFWYRADVGGIGSASSACAAVWDHSDTMVVEYKSEEQSNDAAEDEPQRPCLPTIPFLRAVSKRVATAPCIEMRVIGCVGYLIEEGASWQLRLAGTELGTSCP